MPWCDACAKYWTPNSVAAGGACPSCGTGLAKARELRSEARVMGDDGLGGASVDGADATKVPWHFKLMLVSVGIYLAWRAVQGIVWVIHKL
jgi:hypothetical protein